MAAAAAGRSAKRAMRHFGPWKVVTTEKSSIFYGATPSSSLPPLKQAARSRLPAATAAAGADCEMRVDIIKKPLSQNQTAPPSPSLLPSFFPSLCSTLDHMWALHNDCKITARMNKAVLPLATMVDGGTERW